MWLDNKIYEEDLKINVINSDIDWNSLKDKTIFITGATGLIGSLLVNTIIFANLNYHLNCKVIAFVRNKEKANSIFEKQLKENVGLEFVQGNIIDKITVNYDIDYIIHAASQTSSKSFVEDSLGTIDVTLKGTKNVLELAKEKNVKKFVFLSTMEVYGCPTNDEKIDEKHGTNLITTEPRNCYPISKIMAENLSICYAKKYDFLTNIVRLTQTFGAGVNYNDTRVFAEFARCVIEDRDIILHTKGDTKRNYLYTSDAINAILQVLLKSNANEIYNVANEETYCSILEMAKLVAKKNPNIDVKCVVEENLDRFGYAPTLNMNLDTTKLKNLGWKAQVNLDEMYNRLIDFMKDNKN